MTTERSVIHVGIDVSKDKLAVAIAGGGVRDESGLNIMQRAPSGRNQIVQRCLSPQMRREAPPGFGPKEP